MDGRSLLVWDYLVIAAFFAVMVGVGVYYSRKSKDSDQFPGGKLITWSWLRSDSTCAIPIFTERRSRSARDFR